MNARYALMNPGLDPVDPDTFARAFRGVPGLTPVDANRIGQPDCGMLVRHLTLEQATALQSNLQAAGMAAEMVAETKLPTLPDGYVIRFAQCSAESLTFRDCFQRSTAIRRKDVKLLAAGSVRIATFPRQRLEKQVASTHMLHLPIHPIPIMIPMVQRETRVQYIEREAEEWVLRAEIVCPSVSQRLIIEAENFDYSSLGADKTFDVATNFCLLIRELAGTCSPPVVNRGVTSILSDPWEFAYYSNKDAFQNELISLLWRDGLQPAGSHA